MYSRAGAKKLRLEAQTHGVTDLLLHRRFVGGAEADGDSGAHNDKGVRVGSDDGGNVLQGAPDVGHVESAGVRVQRSVDAEQNEVDIVEERQIVRDVMKVVRVGDLTHAFVAGFHTDNAVAGVCECKSISMTNNSAPDLHNGGWSDCEFHFVW